ncbi:MAG TPA: thiamine pyrophosphate-binding protein, partial [Streptosporangiaceae bacterium]|nr:thiamine pyrophosphate-binding protein [Streptosporangiaceae bacterium]
MSDQEAAGPERRHGGALAVEVARGHGVTHMFTLSGGHVFPLYDGAVHSDPPLPLIDVRHEQTAVFAAEATARLTRSPGLAVVTAGPGVTNSVSAVTTAHFNGAPVVVLGGRAPDYRWGAGSLQEIDHPPLLAPVTKRAWTEHATAQVAGSVDEAFRLAGTPHRGPVFLDVSLEAIYDQAAPTVRADGAPSVGAAPDPGVVDDIADRLARAQRPVLVLGSDVWLDGAEDSARACAEAWSLPVIANGQGRGILPAGHPQLITRARSVAFREADLVVVAGAPLDFRLGYGQFGAGDEKAPVVHVADSPGQLATHCPLAAAAAGDLSAFFAALGTAPVESEARDAWLTRLQT